MVTYAIGMRKHKCHTSITLRKKCLSAMKTKQSMQVKAQYTNSKNLGGMMFWESSSDANDDPATQDKDENYELLKEVYYGLNPDQQG